MRYAVFTDIHANLEALEAVLAKIDELSMEKPIDQIWFLGDLVGYGPNPNECITKLRERTDVIIAGNHDWAAVGKIDLEDFSAAARVSAEWTAEQLTEEHRTFLAELPERLEIGECTLVHGSPYGPLWEYLTSEVLAERSFQHFNSRFCFVGHTHVPVIFQQPDAIANAPTLPLVEADQNGFAQTYEDDAGNNDEESEAAQPAAIHPPMATSKTAGQAASAYADHETGQAVNEAETNSMIEARIQANANERCVADETARSPEMPAGTGEGATIPEEDEAGVVAAAQEGESGATSAEKQTDQLSEQDTQLAKEAQDVSLPEESAMAGEQAKTPAPACAANEAEVTDATEEGKEVTPEETMLSAEDRLNSEIEELLALLGLSENMIQVTNEMRTPPEGQWDAPEGQRAIINPGGVGQPRDGDTRAAFMIYDSEEGFAFYRIPYGFTKTQEKIIQAGLPQYLALRLAYGR